MGIKLKSLNNQKTLLLIFLTLPSLNHGLNKVHDGRSERNIKLSTSKKTISHHLTSYNGLIIDKPRIRVVSYRLKNTDPWTITDELNCVGGKGSGEGGIGNCDELVEVGLSSGTGVRHEIPKRLGQGEGETLEWSLPPNMTQLTIECTSKTGPVEWDYVGKGNFPDIEIDNRRLTGDFWTATTYTHISELLFRKVNDQLTGSFICRNVEKPSVSNSFYMFVPQEKLDIYNELEKLEIIPPAHETTVIIPCRPKDKSMSVHLYKKIDGGLKKMNMRQGVSFSPYLGFMMDVSPELYGHYICKVSKSHPPSKERRKKRNISPETVTSPGISFSTIIDDIHPFSSGSEYYTNAVPYSSNEDIGSNSGIEFSPVAIRRRQIIHRRRRKHPVLRRQNQNHIFSRRGGPHHYGPVGPPIMHHNRRPPPPPRPFTHFRRPGGPLRFRPRPQYLQFPYSQNDQHLLPTITEIEYEETKNSSVPSSTPSNNLSIETSEKNSHPYFYPAPIFGFPPKKMKPIKVLPTYINKIGTRQKPFGSSEENYNFSPEIKINSNPTEPLIPSNNKIANTTKNKPPRRGAAAILSQNLLPQTVNIMNSMSCVLKKVMLGPDASCNGSFFDAAATAQRPWHSGSQSHHILGTPEEQDTILEVIIKPPPTNKFFPKETVLYTTVPFFVKWQTRSTDFANWAEVNHTLQQGTFKLHKAGHFQDHGVHSFEVFNLNEGESGKISVPYVGNNNKILTHTWKFFIINTTTYNAKGMIHKEGNPHVFTCRSTSINKPKITLVHLSEDGCSINETYETSTNPSHEITEEDCGPGCSTIKTEAGNGVAHCIGDGVDETIRFPNDVYCTGRPYFVERLKTKNLTLKESQKRLIIPCIINNPNADVYLYHETTNGTVNEVTNYATYDLKAGFTLDVEKIPERYGTYACTSTTNLNDDSDMVTYHVNPAPNYIFDPPHEKLFGSPPFRFVWESTEELQVENKSIGSFYSGVFAKPEGNRPFVGTFEITSLKPGESGEVKVLKTLDKSVVHTWKFSYEGKYGLYVDKKTNVVKCRSTGASAPTLFPVECSNPNVCKLKKQFTHAEEISNEIDDDDRDIVKCGKGCTELKIWKNKPYGFVKCIGEAIDDTLNYFLSRNSTLLTEMDNLDRFKSIEISSVIRKLRVGETINFVCKANKYFYSKGFQWAIETKTGSKRFIDPKSKDSDSYLNDIKSEISLKVGEDWKAVWCYAPFMESNQWGNASQLIYLY